MRTGVRRVAAVVMTLCGVVAGCSDPPKAAPLPSASPTTPTPSTSARSTPPNYEAEVRGAISTYFAALYAAGMDPATKRQPLADLLSASCPCRSVIAVLEDEARQGRHIDYTYRVSDVHVIDAGPLGANAEYTVQQSEGAERDASGRVIERFAASATKYSVHFSRVAGRWLLDRVDERR